MWFKISVFVVYCFLWEEWGEVRSKLVIGVKVDGYILLGVYIGFLENIVFLGFWWFVKKLIWWGVKFVLVVIEVEVC